MGDKVISHLSVCVPLRNKTLPILVTKELSEECEKVTNEVTVEMEFIIVRLF